MKQAGTNSSRTDSCMCTFAKGKEPHSRVNNEGAVSEDLERKSNDPALGEPEATGGSELGCFPAASVLSSPPAHL